MNVLHVKVLQHMVALRMYIGTVAGRLGPNPTRTKIIDRVTSSIPCPLHQGRLMEGTGTGWNNVFLPRATSSQGNSPLSGEKKAAWTPHALKEA